METTDDNKDEIPDEIANELFTFYENMPRQGPGAATVTRNLLQRLRPLLPANAQAADMGCGNGSAGLVLAEEGLTVTGVDIHQPFLDIFEQNAGLKGLSDRITTRRASMINSAIAPASLDLIWSEGAVYIVGFDTALQTFWPLLKPGSVLVMSECVWLQDQVPVDLRKFWDQAYPAMRSTGANIRAGEKAGYRFHHAELLPPDVWETDFYQPMETMLAKLGPNPSPAMQSLIDEQKQEITLFRQYNQLYGYVFHVFVRP